MSGCLTLSSTNNPKPVAHNPLVVSQVVPTGEGATLDPPEDGFSIVIPAEALSQDTKIYVREVSDPASEGSSRAMGPVYEPDLGGSQLQKPIELSSRFCNVSAVSSS